MPFDGKTADYTNTVADVLRRARALIADPKKWGKGDGAYLNPRDLGKDQYCVLTAVGDAAKALNQNQLNPEQFLERVADCEFLGAWNDAPERTHADVMAAFDKAIALAEAGE